MSRYSKYKLVLVIFGMQEILRGDYMYPVTCTLTSAMFTYIIQNYHGVTDLGELAPETGNTHKLVVTSNR